MDKKALLMSKVTGEVGRVVWDEGKPTASQNPLCWSAETSLSTQHIQFSTSTATYHTRYLSSQVKTGNSAYNSHTIRKQKNVWSDESQFTELQWSPQSLDFNSFKIHWNVVEKEIYIIILQLTDLQKLNYDFMSIWIKMFDEYWIYVMKIEGSFEGKNNNWLNSSKVDLNLISVCVLHTLKKSDRGLQRVAMDTGSKVEQSSVTSCTSTVCLEWVVHRVTDARH